MLTEEDMDRLFGEWVPNPEDDGSVWEHQQVIAAGIPTNRVWTLVDGDEGGAYALAGFRIVNRIGYVVTERPWVYEDAEFEIDPPEGDEGDEGDDDPGPDDTPYIGDDYYPGTGELVGDDSYLNYLNRG